MINFHAIAVIVSLSMLSHLGVAAADPLPTETFQGSSAHTRGRSRGGGNRFMQGAGLWRYSRDRGPRRQSQSASGRRRGECVDPRADPAQSLYGSRTTDHDNEMAKAIGAPGAFNPTLYDTRMVIAGGGVPIKAGNEVIGGIGVGGAPGGDKDEACANAGLAKIGDRLN